MTGIEGMLKSYFAIPGIVKSMGLVFGDIGTSPIYTFTAIFLLITSYRMYVQEKKERAGPGSSSHP